DVPTSPSVKKKDGTCSDCCSIRRLDTEQVPFYDIYPPAEQDNPGLSGPGGVSAQAYWGILPAQAKAETSSR
ncbi:MAG TPA: hypothetical protein VMX74_14985, partial [Pirellulales bacterium]|nr:hypothetical protein [Pirellulales bacterium]